MRSPFALSVIGEGSITLDPPQPSEGYCSGTEVTVTAVPDADWVFREWGAGPARFGQLSEQAGAGSGPSYPRTAPGVRRITNNGGCPYFLSFCAAPLGLIREGTLTQGFARTRLRRVYDLHPGLRYVAPMELIQNSMHMLISSQAQAVAAAIVNSPERRSLMNSHRQIRWISSDLDCGSKRPAVHR